MQAILSINLQLRLTIYIEANLQVREFVGSSSEGGLVGHDRDLCCSYPTKQDKLLQET